MLKEDTENNRQPLPAYVTQNLNNGQKFAGTPEGKLLQLFQNDSIFIYHPLTTLTENQHNSS